MGKNPADDPELVVVTSLGVLLNVVFGVIDLLIQSKSIARADVIKLLHELRSETRSYEEGEEMAIELLDGALYRVDNNPPVASGAESGEEAPKAARAA
jgi:hypothetical protein